MSQVLRSPEADPVDPSDPFTNLDPALHPHGPGPTTLHSVDGNGEDGHNPLDAFAQHVLGGRREGQGADRAVQGSRPRTGASGGVMGNDDDAANLLAFNAGEEQALYGHPEQGFGELLGEGGEPGQDHEHQHHHDEHTHGHGHDHERDDHEHHDHEQRDGEGRTHGNDIEGEREGDGGYPTMGESLMDSQHPQPGHGPPPTRKRRRDGEISGYDDSADPMRTKKDTHVSGWSLPSFSAPGGCVCWRSTHVMGIGC
jgi:hypothetical protein